MTAETDYSRRQSIQAGQYETAYHWNSKKKVEARRYGKMSEYFATLVSAHLQTRGAREITVLDFGCGDGFGAYSLARLLDQRGVGARVVGVDVEASAIEWANKLTEEAGGLALEFHVGDIQSGVALVSAGSGPVVVMMREVIEHLPENDIDEILAYLHEKLADALVIISVPSTNSPVEAKHFRHYTEQTLRQVLQRNDYLPQVVGGFGFRPAVFYWLLKRIKAMLNRGSRFWWLLNPLWRAVRPAWAITLVAVAASVPGKVKTPA